MPLNPSHIPRLVYDYLVQIGCSSVADSFATECPYLTGLKFFAETCGNKGLPVMVGPSLSEIVHEYFDAKEKMVDIIRCPNDYPTLLKQNRPQGVKALPCTSTNESTANPQVASCSLQNNDTDISIVYSKIGENHPRAVPSTSASTNSLHSQVDPVRKDANQEKPTHFSVNKAIAVDPDLAFAQHPVIPTVSSSSGCSASETGRPILSSHNHTAEPNTGRVEYTRNGNPVTSCNVQNSTASTATNPPQSTIHGNRTVSPDTYASNCQEILNRFLLGASRFGPRYSHIAQLLVKNLIDGKTNAEHFVRTIQSAFGNALTSKVALVPFLNTAIPHLRRAIFEGKLTIDGMRPSGESTTMQNANGTVPNNQMGSSNVAYSQLLVHLANNSIATPPVQVTPPTSNPPVTGQIPVSSVPQPTTTGEPEEVHQIMKWLFQPVNVPQPRSNTRASPITSTGVSVPATASVQSVPDGLASKPIDPSPSQEALAPKQLLNMPLLQESNLSSRSPAVSSPVASQSPPVSSSAGYCPPTQQHRSDVSSVAPPNPTPQGLQELLFKDFRPVVPSTTASNSSQHSQVQPIAAPPKPTRSLGLRELIFKDYRPPSTSASSNSAQSSQDQPIASVVTPLNPAVSSTENQRPTTTASPVVVPQVTEKPPSDKTNPAPGTSVEKPMTVIYRWSWESMQLSLDKGVSSPISTDSNSNHSAPPEEVRSSTPDEIPQIHIVEDPSEANQSDPADNVEILVVASTSKEGESAKEPEQTVVPADAAESSTQTERTISPTESTALSVTSEDASEVCVNAKQMTAEETKAHHAANKCRKWLAKWLLFVKEKCPESVIREVRMSIQALVDQKLDAENFIKKIKPIFNSSPSPRLAPFLKETLPHLRKALADKTMVLDNIRPPVISAVNSATNPPDDARVCPEPTERSVSSTPSVEEAVPSTSESGASTTPPESRTTSANERPASSASSSDLLFAQTVLNNPIKVEPCNDEVEESTSESSSVSKRHRDESRKKSKKRKRADTKRSEERSIRRKVERPSTAVRPCLVVLRPAFVWNSPEGPIQISK